MYRVVVEQRAPAPSTGLEAPGEHRHHLVELRALQLPVGIGPPHQLEELVHRPVLRRDLGDELLREHLQRLLPHLDPIKLPLFHRPEQRGALHQLVAGEREEPALGGAVHRVPRPPDPLEEGGDPPRRAQLAHQVHVPDVDPQLQRRGGDERAELPRLEPLLGVEPRLLGEAPVVRGHRVLAQPLGKVPRHPLGEATGVDEHEGGAMRLDQLGKPAVDLVPDFVRHDCVERGLWKLEAEIEGSAVAGVDDGRAVRRQPFPHLLDRLHRSRQPDPLDRPASHVLQALQAEGQVRAAPRLQHRVDLVHDDGAHGAEHVPAPSCGEQQIERLRRGDQDMGRRPEHRRALGGGGITRADGGGDLRRPEAHLLRQPADLTPGLGEVPVDVRAQRLEGRDVEDPSLLREDALEALPQQQVQLYKEGGQGFSGPRGGGDQCVPAGPDGLPTLLLRGGRLAQPLGEPAGDDGMKRRQRHAEI